MLKPTELRELWRDLADREVLTVYLDSRVTDPAMRDSWRAAMTNAVRAAGASISSSEERQRFEKAASYLRDPSPLPGGVWGAPGWVAFVTEDGLRYAGDLPVQPVPHAEWRRGPVVAPYMRALKQHNPVFIALVESRSARIYRYALGGLELLETLEAQTEDMGSSGSIATGRSVNAARSTVSTENAARKRQAVFNRMAGDLASRLESLAGEEAFVLIGGASEWAHHAFDSLGRKLDGRATLADSLHQDATDAQIVRAAKDAASSLRGNRGREMVESLLNRGGGHARAAVSIPEIQRGLRMNAVDLLLVSPEFIRKHQDVAEDIVRMAIEQGAAVEVPSGEGAEKLDRDTGGMAARLRFAIDETPEEDTAEAASGGAAR